MSAGLAVVVALGGSACAALAGTLQHRVAGRGRTAGASATGQIARFVRHQLSQRLWWITLGVQAVGLGLHGLALHLGALSLVQPVLALVVVMALPLNHRLNHTRISRAELLWATVLTVGLAAFLLIAIPRRAPVGPIPTARLVVPAGVGLLVLVLCIAVASRAGSQLAAVALGTGSGIAFGFEAAFLQATADRLANQPAGLFGQATVYAWLASGFVGVVLTQLAYRAGPISAALPAVITVNPICSIVLGVVVGGDQLRQSPGAVVGEVVSFAVLAVAVGALARIAPLGDAGNGP
ncbi:MAG TPA: DMT family transporter [Nocardioidaceae bacterium]|nr:DMT family transporter [Nocardioidaceae bacterium]